MGPSATDVLSLPNPLVLLVHLHILEYPHANNQEYDNEIFNSRTRGLRKRAKTMEDIAYFLVGRIEGKSVKTILPTYPCIQPSESLAFRTSLTKYLENVRHQCIYPSSSAARMSGKPGASLKASDSKSNTETTSMAWWWKDVVVRKSLLEECYGNKFERLMLSLSTHALMKASRPIQPDKMSSLLRTQPVVYTSALARYQATRHAWSKSASLLTRSERDLQTLRESLNKVTYSKYTSLSKERLQALAESKLHTLLQDQWAGESGRNALISLVGLAGLRISSLDPKTPSSSSLLSLLPTQTDVDAASISIGFPSPLPIAAAHHPAHLKRLRKAVFQSKTAPRSDTLPPAVPSRRSQTHADIILAAQVDSEKRARQALHDALARLKRINVELSTKFETMSPGRPDLTTSAGASSFSTSFWAPGICASINFDPKPDKALMLSLGLEHEFESLNSDEVDTNEDVLETKIHNIRSVKLPPYPPVPDPLEARKPPLEQAKRVDPKPRITTLQSKHSANSTSGPSTSTPGNSNQRPPAPAALPSTPSESLQLLPPSTPLLSPGKSSRSIRRKSVRFSMATRRSGRPSMFRVFSDGLEDEVDRLVDETHDFPTDDEDEDGDTDTEGQGHGQFLSPYKTPRSAKTRPAINRIWTAGTPISAKKSHGTPKHPLWQKPRASSALTRLVDMDSGVGLPSLGSLTSEEEGVFGGMGKGDEMEEDEEEEEGYGAKAKDVDATPRPALKTLSLPLIRRSSASGSAQLAGASPNSDEDDGDGFEDQEDVFDDRLDDPPSMTLKDILLSADTSHFDLLEFSSDDIGEGVLVEDASFVWE